MRVIILGSNGMLGSMLQFVGSRTSHEIIALTRNEFHATQNSIQHLDNWLTNDCCIVNCIGAIPQRKCIDEEFHVLNTAFPLSLANYCESKSVPMIHISTNCVFDDKGSNYIETDTRFTHEIYGLSKQKGEPPNALTLRCSIIGLEKNTSFGLMEWFLHAGPTVNGYQDHYWNGITTFELSNIIFEYINNKNFSPSLIHYASEHTVSKCELLEYINTLFHLEKKINPIYAGTTYYTLSSIITTPRKHIFKQLDELYDRVKEYRTFHSLDPINKLKYNTSYG
jgi:dTDP-4-dehydrorhamnose reductase